MHHVTAPGLCRSASLGLAAITTMVGGCFYVIFSPAQSEQQNRMRAVLCLVNDFYFPFTGDGLSWQLLFD